MNNQDILRYIVAGAFGITFIGAGVYLGIRLWEISQGDFILFCVFLMTLLLMATAMERNGCCKD